MQQREGWLLWTRLALWGSERSTARVYRTVHGTNFKNSYNRLRSYQLQFLRKYGINMWSLIKKLPSYLSASFVRGKFKWLLPFFFTVVYSERDNFEAELKELKRRFETVDLAHAALTRERDTLGNEVHHTYPPTYPRTYWALSCLCSQNVPGLVVFFLPCRWQRCSNR